MLAEKDYGYEARAKTGIQSLHRLYYALFYAVYALLYLSYISVKKHASVKSQFTLNYIKTGRLDKKYGQLLSELFDWIQQGDYENIFEYDEESVMPLIPAFEEMINAIEKIVKRELTS